MLTKNKTVVRCPKCSGFLVVEKVEDFSAVACVNCGFRKYSEYKEEKTPLWG